MHGWSTNDSGPWCEAERAKKNSNFEEFIRDYDDGFAHFKQWVDGSQSTISTARFDFAADFDHFCLMQGNS